MSLLAAGQIPTARNDIFYFKSRALKPGQAFSSMRWMAASSMLRHASSISRRALLR
jgi:hypothetical protein